MKITLYWIYLPKFHKNNFNIVDYIYSKKSLLWWVWGGIMSQSLETTTPTTMMWYLFGFHDSLVEMHQVSGCSMSSPSDSGRTFSLLRKTKACLVWGNAWVFSKTLQRDLFSCPSVIKIVYFSSCIWNIECLHALSKKLTLKSLAMNLIDLLGSL